MYYVLTMNILLFCALLFIYKVTSYFFDFVQGMISCCRSRGIWVGVGEGGGGE